MRRRVLFTALSLLFMLLIFTFSAKNADESTVDSHRVGLAIGRVFVRGFEDLSEEEQIEYADSIEFPVRKAAHATEYLILAVLVLGAMTVRRPTVLSAFLSWIITVAYACTDEIHQLFVPGRSGQVRDVCIDGGGALVGVLLVLLIAGLTGRRKRKKSKEQMN